MSIEDVIKKSIGAPLRVNQRSITVRVPAALETLRSELDCTMQSLVGAMVADGLVKARKCMSSTQPAILWLLHSSIGVVAIWEARPTVDDLRLAFPASTSYDALFSLAGMRCYIVGDREYTISEIPLTANISHKGGNNGNG